VCRLHLPYWLLVNAAVCMVQQAANLACCLVHPTLAMLHGALCLLIMIGYVLLTGGGSVGLVWRIE